jgi:hypothetical protein
MTVITSQQAIDSEPSHSKSDFKVFAEGIPFERLQGEQLRESLRRWGPAFVVLVPLLAWMPLLLLSAIEGLLFRGKVEVPFALDLEVHVRLLLALPALLIAGRIAQKRMRPLLRNFYDRHLIPSNAIAEFEAAVKSAFRLRDSVIADILLIAFVYVVGVLLFWRQFVALETSTWYVTSPAEGADLTIAGLWFAFVSLPIFQFVLCRLYYRLFIWARFLWQVSRLDLKLMPTHPDGTGGLGFISEMTRALLGFALAHGILLSGWLATRVVVAGQPLTEFKGEIAVMLIFVLCVTLGPLLVFLEPIRRARRIGLREYGTLATRYIREFDAKWLRGGDQGEEQLVGSSDVQSLADLGNSYSIIQGMRSTPITRGLLLRFSLATLIPIAPLLLTMIPLEKLLKKLITILF